MDGELAIPSSRARGAASRHLAEWQYGAVGSDPVSLLFTVLLPLSYNRTAPWGSSRSATRAGLRQHT